MDNFDRKILIRVQNDSRQTAEQIGTEVGLSGAAIQKRLKRLRADGIIKSEIAVLDPKKLDHSMTAIVEVTLVRETRQVLDAFKRRMREAPNVQQCYYTTGEADFVLIVIIRDIVDYEHFTREYFFDIPEVAKFKTSIVMDTVKTGLNVPIENSYQLSMFDRS